MNLLPKRLETLKRNAKKNIMPLLTPYLLKLRINTYAPYIGASIKIEHMNLDQGLCVVSMGLNNLNKNIVGTQFGGSLYSMVDPFYMLMLMHQLGSSYVVWDKSSHIDAVFTKNGLAICCQLLNSDYFSTANLDTRGDFALTRRDKFNM